MNDNADQAGAQRAEETPKGTLTFTFDPATGALSWRKEGGPIPHALLVNALECVKAMYVAEQLAGMQMRRTGPPPVCLPDGTPFRR